MWLRYINDNLFIWTHGEDKLKTFFESLSQLHPNTKFTHESSKKSIHFLDLSNNFLRRKIKTGLHKKPTGRHQYLHCSSSHSGHTK